MICGVRKISLKNDGTGWVSGDLWGTPRVNSPQPLYVRTKLVDEMALLEYAGILIWLLVIIWP